MLFRQADVDVASVDNGGDWKPMNLNFKFEIKSGASVLSCIRETENSHRNVGTGKFSRVD